MYNKNLTDAAEIFKALLEKEPTNSRYVYHLLCSELLQSNIERANELEQQLKTLDCDDYIATSNQLVEAYLLALDSKNTEAEQVLSAIQTENDYIKQKILSAQAYYLCKINDTTRLQFLLHSMDDKTKSYSSYLQALACLEGGHLDAAVINLQPHAEKTKLNQKLFYILSADLSRQALVAGNTKRAIEVLQQVKNPTGPISSALESLKISSLLDKLDSIEVVRETIDVLAESIQNVSDKLMKHNLQNNLGLLLLRLAILTEESETKENVADVWDNVLNFWESYVFSNREYWNMCLERISDADEFRPLPLKEIDGLNKKFRKDYLLNLFIGHLVLYIEQGSAADMQRHFDYIAKLGELDNNLGAYVGMADSAVKEKVASFPKNDPILKTWDFVITYMSFQVISQEILKLQSIGPLEAQLEAYLEYRNHYGSPVEYMRAKKVFNTNLLDAMQSGINGKFRQAGDKLDETLNNKPSGVTLGELEEVLWELRDACRQASKAADDGRNLSHEFERLYQRVLNYTMQKGS